MYLTTRSISQVIIPYRLVYYYLNIMAITQNLNTQFQSISPIHENNINKIYPIILPNFIFQMEQIYYSTSEKFRNYYIIVNVYKSKMEQLLKLPQIRISLLEKIISQRKAKHSQQKQPSSSRPEYPLILGEKPFYTSNRKSDIRCFCSQMKCDCKNNKKNEKEINRHQYLNRRKRGQNKFIKCKTQSQQIEYQPFYKNSRNKKRKNQHFSSYVETEIMYIQVKNKVSELYSKIQKQFIGKLFKKYGLQLVNMQIKNQIIKYLTQFYLQKWKKLKQGKIDISKDYKIIMKQIQKVLKSKQKNQIVKNQKQNKAMINPILKKSIKSIKNIKNQKNKKQTYQSQNDTKQIYRKKDQFYQIQKNKIQQLSHDILISHLVGTANQSLTDEFFKSLINADMQEFSQKLNKIEQVLIEFDNKGRVKKLIIDNINKLIEKIQQSDLSYKIKEQKLKAIKKKLRFTPSSDKNEQKQVKNLYALYKQRSRKTIKKTKTVKSFRKFEGNEQYQEYQSEQGGRRVSNLSLADGLQITQYCEQQVGKSRQNLNKLEKKTSKRSSCVSIRLNQNNIGQMDLINENEKLEYQNNLKKTQQYVNFGVKQIINNQIQQKIERKKKTVFDPNLIKIRKGKTQRKFLTIKQDGILSNQEQQVKILEVEQNAINNQTNEQQNQSIFKREHEKQAKFLKQKTKINNKMIEKFMEQNIKVVQKAKFHLKKQRMQEFIIQNTDSVLLKKKKMRKLRSLITTLKQSNKNEIVSQLLKYINCYETECRLIMNKKKGYIGSQYIKTEKDYTCIQDLVDKNRIQQDLKFIRLSDNYHYGEQQDNQLDFMGPFNIIQEVSYIQKPLKSIYGYRELLQNSFDKKNGNLIQTDLPQLGHIQQTLIEKKEEVITETKICNNQNKLYKRIRKYIEQKKQQTQKFIRSNKFLLTQNTMSILSDTSRARFSQS